MLQPKERFIVDEHGERIGGPLESKTTRDYSKSLRNLKLSGPMTLRKRLEMRCCPWSRPWRRSKKTDHDVYGFDLRRAKESCNAYPKRIMNGCARRCVGWRVIQDQRGVLP